MATSKPATVVTLFRGLDQRWEPATGSGISAAVAEDLWYNPLGAWQTSGGYERIIRGPETIPPTVPATYQNPFAGVGAIESIHFFSQHTGARRWILYIDGTGKLYEFNPAKAARSASPGDRARDREGNTITRSVVEGPWIRSQSASWGDVFYMVNGIDAPLVFNGTVWDTAGWQGAPGAPSATPMNVPQATDYGGANSVKIPNVGLGQTSDTAGADYKFARRYRLSFVNDRGGRSPLSEPSELVYFVNTGGTDSANGAHFAAVNIQTGNASCVARDVYCTQNIYDSSGVLVQGRDEQYFYWGRIRDNVSTVFQDSKDDGFLVQLVDPLQFGPWPAGATIIAPFKGRMYAVVDGEIRYSARGNPEEWPVLNVLDVGDAHLGPVTVLYASRNALLAAKSRGIYLIKDDGVSSPTVETLTRQSGWTSQNTVREIPGIGVIGLSDEAITVLKGTLQNEGVETQVFNAGVGLPSMFHRLNTTALANACSAVYHKDKEYWLCVPMLGNQNNTLVLVFHYEIREWTTRNNFPICSMLETPNTEGALIFGSYASTGAVSPDGLTHLGIYVYSRGAADKEGTAIAAVYQTNQITVANAFRTFKPLHLLPRVIAHGNKLRGSVYANYSTSPISTAQGVAQLYPQQYNPLYGASGSGNPATYDSGKKWVNWFPCTVRLDLPSNLDQPIFSAAIRYEPAAGTRYMTLLGTSLEIQPSDPTDTKPLKPDGTN